MPRADLAALLERVEAASGPNQQLDAEIICALLAPEGCSVKLSPINGRWYVETAGGMAWTGFSAAANPLTASLDAALALVVRLYPNEPGMVGILMHRALETWGDYGNDVISALALALLAALIRALMEQADA